MVTYTKKRVITIFVIVDGVTFYLFNTYISHITLQAAGSIPDDVTETFH
jgi:hypothetical protein